MNLIKQKFFESFKSVFPIAAIVLVLSLTLIPDISSSFMILFLFGVVLLIVGMSFFTLGAEMSMQTIGSQIGSSMAKNGKVWLIAFISFIIGIAITVAEPDLQILAGQIYGAGETAKQWILILTVGVGVGIFLVIAVLRIIFGVNLNVILTVFYIIAIVLSFFLPKGFQPLAFDSGGVTTGPMTVPFIMSLGAGVSAGRRNKEGSADSFGITALCSIGPIISVMVLGIIMKFTGATIPEYNVGDMIGELTHLEGSAQNVQGALTAYWPTIVGDFSDGFFAGVMGSTLFKVAIALLPMIIFTLLFQLFVRCFTGRQMIRVGVGIVYTFLGLVVFLAGAEVGFLPCGFTIGEALADLWHGALLIPVSMLLGFFIVKVEPAVYVLNHLVEEMSAGAISAKTTGRGLSVGVAAALGLAAIRIMTGINILWFLIPGYTIALVLCFFVPKIFVGIAFDSGGVASGTMMSAFVLPLCIGACSVLNEGGGVGAAVLTDAFGCVAFVAMAPIITIQISGLIYVIKSKRRKHSFVTKSESFVEYPRRKRATVKAEGVKSVEKKAE